MNNNNTRKWYNEQGYALYVVVVVSFLIFMVLTHTLAYYINQVKVVQMKEDTLRAHLLLQSAVVLWLEHLNVEEMESLPAERLIRELELEGGSVRIYKLNSPNVTEWTIRISATPFQNDVRHRAELKIDKETKQIIHWTERISR